MGAGGLFEDPPTIANDTAQPETSSVAPASPIKGKTRMYKFSNFMH